MKECLMDICKACMVTMLCKAKSGYYHANEHHFGLQWRMRFFCRPLQHLPWYARIVLRARGGLAGVPCVAPSGHDKYAVVLENWVSGNGASQSVFPETDNFHTGQTPDVSHQCLGRTWSRASELSRVSTNPTKVQKASSSRCKPTTASKKAARHNRALSPSRDTFCVCWL